MVKYCDGDFGFTGWIFKKFNQFYQSIMGEPRDEYKSIMGGVKGYGKKDFTILYPANIKMKSELKISLNHIGLKWKNSKKSSQKVKIDIYNMNGKRIYSKNIRNSNFCIVYLSALNLKYGEKYTLFVENSKGKSDFFVFEYSDIESEPDFNKYKRTLPENRGSYDYVIKLAYIYYMLGYNTDAQTITLDYLRNNPEDKVLKSSLEYFSKN